MDPHSFLIFSSDFSHVREETDKIPLEEKIRILENYK